MSALEGRCGTCARFVRVVETIDANGEVLRSGECLLGVWPSPLRETMTCSHYLKRGTVHLRPAPAPTRASRPRSPDGTSEPQARRGRDRATPSSGSFGARARAAHHPRGATGHERRRIPRGAARSHPRRDRDRRRRAREPLGRRRGDSEAGQGGHGGEASPDRCFFPQGGHDSGQAPRPRAANQCAREAQDEEKVQMQQYVTGCYGTLTTFNVLFANRDDGFTRRERGRVASRRRDRPRAGVRARGLRLHGDGRRSPLARSVRPEGASGADRVQARLARRARGLDRHRRRQADA